MTRRGASGGKAEATGGDYETRVAAWYCARVLPGGAVRPQFDLPADVRLVSASRQTDAPVDDVDVKTSRHRLTDMATQPRQLWRGPQRT
jgi:hypothetical protein